MTGRTEEIFRLLADEYPEAKTALNYSNPFQFLVAVILSAQTTDLQVNKVTEKLFDVVFAPDDILRLGPFFLEESVRSLGLFRQKSRQIMETSRILAEKYGGEIPSTREELENLPGVGRKSASVILSVIFNEPALAVDTHVARVSRRLGLTDGATPYAVEEDLCMLLPPESWSSAHHRLIYHGRNICRARKPLCDMCVVADYCPKNYL